MKKAKAKAVKKPAMKPKAGGVSSRMVSPSQLGPVSPGKKRGMR